MVNRELARHDRLIALKNELIAMLDGDNPSLAQSEIIKNIEIKINEGMAELALAK
jgi:hypothetical protein